MLNYANENSGLGMSDEECLMYFNPFSEEEYNFVVNNWTAVNYNFTMSFDSSFAFSLGNFRDGVACEPTAKFSIITLNDSLDGVVWGRHYSISLVLFCKKIPLSDSHLVTSIFLYKYLSEVNVDLLILHNSTELLILMHQFNQTIAV